MTLRDYLRARRAAVTPVTPAQPPEVTKNTNKINDVTPVTPVTPQNNTNASDARGKAPQRQGPESNSTPASAPQAANEKSPGAADAWQAADRAYRRHVEACAICAAAGRGYGQRCPAGADLWARYERLPGPAAPRQKTTGHDAITQGPHPYQAERLRNWSPASEEEIGRMAAVQARALALGMHEAEAERLADVVHWGRRCGDERAPCVTCAHLRAGSDSRWRCAVQHLALPVELVALPHRCPHRLEALP